MPTKLVASKTTLLENFKPTKTAMWLNFNNRNEFVEEIFVKEEFDIFGILSKGMSFKDENSADIIVKIFESEKKSCLHNYRRKMQWCEFYVYKY